MDISNIIFTAVCVIGALAISVSLFQGFTSWYRVNRRPRKGEIFEHCETGLNHIVKYSYGGFVKHTPVDANDALSEEITNIRMFNSSFMKAKFPE